MAHPCMFAHEYAASAIKWRARGDRHLARGNMKKAADCFARAADRQAKADAAYEAQAKLGIR